MNDATQNQCCAGSLRQQNDAKYGCRLHEVPNEKQEGKEDGKEDGHTHGWEARKQSKDHRNTCIIRREQHD